MNEPAFEESCDGLAPDRDSAFVRLFDQPRCLTLRRPPASPWTVVLAHR